MDILKNLLDQHQELKKQLDAMNNAELDSDSSCLAMVVMLKNLKSLLQQHMKLEDDIFYPQMLARMKGKNFETSETEQFIAEMKLIYGVATEFFEKYDDSMKIVGSTSAFKNGLAVVRNAVLDRISAEEDGVYMYWNM